MLQKTTVLEVMSHLGYEGDYDGTAPGTYREHPNVYLGYPVEPLADAAVRIATINYPPYLEKLIIDTAAELTTIKAQWKAARGDSMAVKVGELTVDYKQHLRVLKTDGMRLENLLSQLTTVKLRASYWGGNSNRPSMSFVAYG